MLIVKSAIDISLIVDHKFCERRNIFLIENFTLNGLLVIALDLDFDRVNNCSFCRILQLNISYTIKKIIMTLIIVDFHSKFKCIN